MRRFITRLFVFFCFALLANAPASFAVEATLSATPGLSATAPSDGPFVELGDGQFMVPYVQRIPGTDIEFEMIPVPGGDFQFGGSDDDPEVKEDELPSISLSAGPMWVAKTEVRWDMYLEYMRMYAVFKEFESNGTRTVDSSDMTDVITAPTELYDPSFTFEYGEEPDQPAVTMTQYAAQQFTKWLSKITGVQYRLPTEAEWEYAARAGTQTAYSFGDDPETIDEYAWYFDNAFEGPAPVGTKKPNAFGLHDMHGNVAEWTVNQYTEDGYQWLKDAGVSHAVNAANWPESPWPCVSRGGSWEMDPPDLRSTSRLASDDEEWKSEDPNFPLSPWWFTSDPSRGVGFRLFRSADPLPPAEIQVFWQPSSEDTVLDVESRIESGRGGWGLVDPELPEAAADIGK
ncbi:MAG: formylglycine-generating enzyme family protein [Planctomycetota bacterium]